MLEISYQMSNIQYSVKMDKVYMSIADLCFFDKSVFEFRAAVFETYGPFPTVHFCLILLLISLLFPLFVFTLMCPCCVLDLS